MKKLLGLILVSVLIASCNNEYEPTLVKVLKIEKAEDSVFVYSDGHIRATFKTDTVIPDYNRYFLVSYRTQVKETEHENYGDIWFSCSNGFPYKNQIDSLVYDGMPYFKSCYKPIIIVSIYEFKNKDDYDRFDYNYKGNRPKHKISCK